MSKPKKVEIYEDKRGEFRFIRKGMNGEPIATGEGYTTLSGAKAAVADQFPDDTVKVLKSE